MVIYLSIYENICWYVWEAWMSRVLPFLVVNHFTTWKDGGATVLSDVLKDTPSNLTEPCLTALELMKCLGVSRCKPIPSIGSIKRWHVYLQFGWFLKVNVSKYHTWLTWETHLGVFGSSTPKKKKWWSMVYDWCWGLLKIFVRLFLQMGLKLQNMLYYSMVMNIWSVFVAFLNVRIAQDWQGLIMFPGKTSSRNRWMRNPSWWCLRNPTFKKRDQKGMNRLFADHTWSTKNLELAKVEGEKSKPTLQGTNIFSPWEKDNHLQQWPLMGYCWWLKSCTTKDDDCPIIQGFNHPSGAGFCSSTVC